LADPFHHPLRWVDRGQRPESGEDSPGGSGFVGATRTGVEVPAKILGDGCVELVVEQGLDEIEGLVAAHRFNR
jgi:hypothetical protein